MSIKVINDVFDNSDMRGNDRLVMLAIADNADEEKRQAWPSVSNIAYKTRIPVRTVWRCIKRCVESGELKIIRSGSKDGGSNLYEVTVERSSRVGPKSRGSDTLTGVPLSGIPPMPPGGTLTVIEPSDINTPSLGKILEDAKGKKPLGKGTLEEVVEFCRAAGLPASDGEWFFNKCEGNGWTNDGKQIRNWRATIRAWIAAGYMASQKQKQSATQNAKPSAFHLKTVLEAKERMADEIKRKYCLIVASGNQWSDQRARAEYLSLRSDIKRIVEQIANM